MNGPYVYFLSAYVHTKNSSNLTTTVSGSDQNNRSSSTMVECSVDEEEYTENETSPSLGNDAFRAMTDHAPSPVFELSPDDEQEQDSQSGNVNKNVPPVEESSLPAKYKTILRGFVSNLKEKFNLHDAKTEFVVHSSPLGAFDGTFPKASTSEPYFLLFVDMSEMTVNPISPISRSFPNWLAKRRTVCFYLPPKHATTMSFSFRQCQLWLVSLHDTEA